MTAAFLFFSLVVVIAAWRVVTTPNIARAALALVVVLAGLVPIFILLAAEFIAVIQLLIYVGAVVVLFLFGIMLTRSPEKPDVEQRSRFQNLTALVTSAVLLVLLVAAIAGGDISQRLEPQEVGRTADVGDVLLREFVIPFEAVSLLLLAALVGAIAIARRD